MKPEKRGPSIPRSVVAQMRERYIFNFRLKPDALARHLPVKWLAPQVINGWSALSFCILKLERITIWPIPALVNFSTISCAYRIGVMDLSGDRPEPSVYITDRNADLPIIIRTAPLLFADAIPALKARVEKAGAITRIVSVYRTPVVAEEPEEMARGGMVYAGGWGSRAWGARWGLANNRGLRLSFVHGQLRRGSSREF